MNKEAQNIQKQIQELENLAKEMLDAGNLDEEIFEQIYQQIDKLELQRKQALELQQKKLADEARYLEESDERQDIQDIYKKYDGKEPTVSVTGIKGDAAGLEGVFNNFITNESQQPQVVFVNQDNHWLTVRLEKTPEGGMTYQVADSMPETTKAEQIAEIDASDVDEQTKEVMRASVEESRKERIDALLGDVCAKIPFKSEKQQNGYDCGIYCALNAVDMKTNLIDGVKYSNAKSTYSKYDVETIRENFEKERLAKQEPQQQSRLSSASTASSLSSNSNRSHSPQLKNSQLQRPRSASSLRSSILIKPHSPLLKRQASEILINKGSSNSRYF